MCIVYKCCYVKIICVFIKAGKRGGGRGGEKYLGPGLVWGPEILIKHLVIALLSRGLGARNA